ncbi:hypothetical protein [Lactobacillus helsingborgensis]|uniref:Uncharacterized protein n=1 Tax=Lactobacillus helsingborgensis TaxID=1218494 RepID=A0AA47B5H4_9LACO|nr:hypothetical protein LDX53_06910 [Lactobacillus helsingborgensis]
MNNKKYYDLGNDQFVKATSVSGNKRN